MNFRSQVLMLVYAGWTILSASAQNNPQPAPGPQVTFVNPDYDFGKAAAGTLVKCNFAFTNTGNQVLVIQSVQPSCGCTSAGNWDTNVEPGRTGSIPIQFNSAGYGGSVEKSVTVTCNDPAHGTVNLSFHGIITKQFEVTPTYAVFNLPPDEQTNQTRVIKIVNDTDEAQTVSNPSCGNPAFKLALATIREGKEYELSITVSNGKAPGSISAPITLKTSSQETPSLSVVAIALTQPWFAVKPPQVTVPATPLAQAQQFTVTVQNNGARPVVLSNPEINAPGAEVQLNERQPGRQFTLTLKFPAGFQCPPGLQTTVKSDNPQYPLITIPINQPR